MSIDAADWARTAVPGYFIPGPSGTTLVVVANTRVPLRASTAIKVVTIRARSTNVGLVYLGSSTVTADESATTGGYPMAAGDVVVLAVNDISLLYVNGAAGDGVSYLTFV